MLCIEGFNAKPPQQAILEFQNRHQIIEPIRLFVLRFWNSKPARLAVDLHGLTLYHSAPVLFPIDGFDKKYETAYRPLLMHAGRLP